MRTKILVLFFMLILSFLVKAEEKSYLRDSTSCKMDQHVMDLEVRSSEQYSHVDDSDYGESIVIKHNGNAHSIQMNNNGIGRYRMIKLYNDVCSKILAMPLNPNELAFLLLKDNRPFTDLLTVLYYNLKTGVSEIITTKLPIKSALMRKGKVYLRLAKDQPEQKFGTLVMDNIKYNYIQKPFEPWISFDGVHFKTDRVLSFNNFEFKHLLSKTTFNGFKDLDKISYQVATFGSKRCLSFENSPWVCN